MTYEELYSQATTWTARHVAQDLMLMYGRKTVASQFDIETVNRWQFKEGGTAIISGANTHHPILVAAAAEKKDYLVVLSPGEGWQSIWLVMDAPNQCEAEQMVWTERRYNSGEPVRVRQAADRAAATNSAEYVTTYDAKRVEESREMVQYND